MVPPGTDGVRFQRAIRNTLTAVARPPESSSTSISTTLPASGAAWASRSSAMSLTTSPRTKTPTISTWWRIACWEPESCMVKRRLAAVLITVVTSWATTLAVGAAIVARSAA
jgi:hypothetical protein